MSITRSRSPAAPVTKPDAVSAVGVLLVGHGSPSRTGPARTLAGHARVLKRMGRFSTVRHAVLSGGPDPARELAAMVDQGRVLVLPMFMSDGYLVRHVLRERLGSGGDRPGVHVCPPIGLAPELVNLIVEVAEEIRSVRGWLPNAWDLMLAAHGSTKDPASRHSADTLARSMARVLTVNRVRTAFLEEAPFLANVSDHLIRPTVVVGLFAAGGGHAREDVPQALKSARQPVAYAGAIGCDRRIPNLIGAALERELRKSVAAA